MIAVTYLFQCIIVFTGNQKVGYMIVALVWFTWSINGILITIVAMKELCKKGKLHYIRRQNTINKMKKQNEKAERILTPYKRNEEDI